MSAVREFRKREMAALMHIVVYLGYAWPLYLRLATPQRFDYFSAVSSLLAEKPVDDNRLLDVA